MKISVRNSLNKILKIIIGAAVGIFIVIAAQRLMWTENTAVFALCLVICVLVFFCSFELMIMIHELGHFICGKISGYKLISFRVGSVIYVRGRGLKRFSVLGTFGQCLMEPPDIDDDSVPYMLYNAGGNIAAGVCAAVSGAFALLCDVPWLFCVSSIFFTAAAAVFLENAIPFLSGREIPNDAKNTVILKNSQAARHAVMIQLRVAAKQALGVRLSDMPGQWFEQPEYRDLTNPFIAELAVMEVMRAHDRMDFRLASKICDSLLKQPELHVVYRMELQCERLFYELIGDRNKSVIDRLYTAELRNYIKITRFNPGRQRLMFAWYSLYERKPRAAENALELFEKNCRDYPFDGEAEAEREIILKIKELI